MLTPEPLEIRRSRGNFNYLFSTALGIGFLVYSYGLYARWPIFSSRFAQDDSFLIGLLALFGTLMLLTSSLRPVLDRVPLMTISDEGISPRETGNLPVPWSEIGDWRFEKISEGRASYWYFFFTQTDAATNMQFDYKVSADEFDCSNEEVVSLIERYKEKKGKGTAVPKPRPDSIESGLDGEALSVGYSPAKEWMAIGLYWSIAAVALVVLGYAAVMTEFGSFSLSLLRLDPIAVFWETNIWFRVAAGVICAAALAASAFRLRDLFFRTKALTVSRAGVASPDLGDEIVPWKDIAAIKIEPYGVMHISVIGGPAPGERFIDIPRLSLSQQEIFNAMCWLAARYKANLRRSVPWDERELPPAQFRG